MALAEIDLEEIEFQAYMNLCAVGSAPLFIPPQLGIHACILTATGDSANRLWVYWFCPVITDTVIVLLVVMYVLVKPPILVSLIAHTFAGVDDHTSCTNAQLGPKCHC